MKQISEVLKSIESILIGAGESCPENYQNGFNWKEYIEGINLVKKEVLEHHYFTLRKVEQLKDMIDNKDMILLAEHDHEVTEYFNRHLLNDKE